MAPVLHMDKQWTSGVTQDWGDSEDMNGCPQACRHWQGLCPLLVKKQRPKALNNKLWQI